MDKEGTCTNEAKETEIDENVQTWEVTQTDSMCWEKKKGEDSPALSFDALIQRFEEYIKRAKTYTPPIITVASN